MSEIIDKEIDAIGTVLKALEPLPVDVQANVIDYVLKRLQITPSNSPQPKERPLREVPGAAIDASTLSVAEEVGIAEVAPVHLKDFKAEKKPRSANEMAAIVAYYLENLVSPEERKETIGKADIDTYFKIAEFRLPEKTQFTLPNAKSAGYFDSVGGGEYKLNAIGHNLVVHSMPRGSGERVRKARRPSADSKTSSKKTRKAPAKKK